nr:response regulator [uncultured Desulfobulbus sp.]
MTEPQISVLLIEDSLPQNELIKSIFEEASLCQYTLVSAARLSQGIELLQSRAIDIVILDLGLPDSSGLSTLEQLLPVAINIPIIVLTGNDDSVLGQQAIRYGAQDFLAKGNGTEMMLPRVCFYALERHRLQQQVQETESFLRSIINSLTARIAITDSEGHIILVNEAWRKFGAESGTQSECINEGANYFDACLPISGNDSAIVTEFLQKSGQMLIGEIDGFAMEYPCHSAEEKRWFRMEASLFSGTGRGSLVFAHYDITERKRIELSLKTNEEFLRRIFDTSPNVVFVKDDKGKYVMANEALAKIYGTTVEQMIGRSDVEIMSEQNLKIHEAQSFQAIDAEVLATQKPRYIAEECLTDRSGVTRWYRTIKTPITFPGLPTYLLGIASDISNERMDKQQIRNSELLLRTILDTMHHSILLLDKDKRVIWANKKAVTLVEQQQGKIKGQFCSAIWKHEEMCKRCPAQSALASGKITIESVQIGRSTTLRMTGSPVYDEKGEITSVLCMAEDVSERASLEQQLRQAQKMEALGTLAGGIAHDFNNILTAILGFTELGMHQVAHGQDLARYLQEVYQASIRARDLVQQILTFSRRLDQELKPLDITFIIKEALKLLRSTLPSSVEMRSRFATDPGKIMADPTQIHQIMMNLCTNSAHAMKNTGGVLSVSLEQASITKEDRLKHPTLSPGEYLQLQVADTGHGIPQDILQSIFEPYFTTKRQGEGTGLGLAVVHGIVRDYRGDIHVQSVPGEGTTFSILFPVYTQDVGEPGAIYKKPAMPMGNGETILVVDDEPAIVRLCQKILEKAGYRVTTATDPQQALQQIVASPEKFDLLLTDMTMPHMCGNTLTKEALKCMPQLPVVVMSGNTSKVKGVEGSEGKVSFIPKPLDRRQLLTMIDQSLAPKKGA